MSDDLNADQMALLLEPKRPLLYFFQHVALRQAAFINHPELIKELVEPSSDRPLIHFWSMACLRCEEAGLFADEAAMSDYWMEAVQIHQYTKNGFAVFVITMPKPEFSLEAFFVSIVHKDGEPHQYGSRSAGNRYFTLEKTDVAGPLLCEWLDERGSRRNYGERGSSVPTEEAFADAVFDLLS